MTETTRNASAGASLCPMGACMSLLGGTWTTSVIWQLSAGARRFGELRRDIPGISPKMLTARLRELEAKHVVIREVAPSSPPAVLYRLSALGRELVPVIDAMVRLGTRLLSAAPRRAPRRPRARRARSAECPGNHR